VAQAPLAGITFPVVVVELLLLLLVALLLNRLWYCSALTANEDDKSELYGKLVIPFTVSFCVAGKLFKFVRELVETVIGDVWAMVVVSSVLGAIDSLSVEVLVAEAVVVENRVGVTGASGIWNSKR
jgi:hypothetical protein